MASMAQRSCEVVVVGAGIAGLVAARELRRQGVDILVLEARDRVGGRTLNHCLGEGKVVELGGQWVGPGQHHVIALIEELGLTTFDTFDEGRNLWEYRGRIRSCWQIPKTLQKLLGRSDLPTEQIPKAWPWELFDLFIGLTRLERMSTTVPLEAPWTATNASDWDSQTVASWGKHNLRTALARSVLGVICEAVWAADPADVSLLHLLVYAHASGGLDNLLSTSGGAQQSRIVGGSQQISLTMAAELGDAVLLNTAVRGIEHGSAARGVRVHADNITVHARRVIIAVSPALAGRLTYQPPLPADRDQLTQRTPNGSVIKCMAVYDEPFWRRDGLSGQVISDIGPVKLVYDNSPPDGRPGVLVGFLEGNAARALGRVSEQQRRGAVLSCFTRYFGPTAADPIDYVDKHWADEEWTRGCYGAFLPPGAWTAFGAALRNSIGPIHWAGTETALQGMGYMDGAVDSGQRAAAEILRELPELSADGSRTRWLAP